MTSIFLNACTYLAPAAVSLALTPVLIQVAKTYGLVDQPNARKVHRTPVPRVGGIAITLATALTLVFVLFRPGSELLADSEATRKVLTLLIGATAIAVVGFVDDIFEIRSKYKLLALLAASLALCAAGGALQSIILTGTNRINLGIASWPLTMMWIVGITVSINFIDGLDGLAGGIGVIACGVMAICGLAGADPTTMLIALALAGALSGFLVYNFHPAKVFMGDCGSMFVGFLIAGTCVLAAPRVGTTRGLLLPAFALLVPLLDTVFTMVRRGVLQRRSLFAAERGHIHHRLLDIGLCHLHVVLLLYGLTAFAGAVAVVWVFGGYIMSAMAVMALTVGVLTVFKMAGSMRARDTVAAIRRNRALSRENMRYQHAFYDMQLRFRDVEDFSSWWKLLCMSAEVFDFAKVDLPITRRDGSSATMRWRRDNEALADPSAIVAEVPIPQRRNGETLRATIEVTVTEFLETAGTRVALFSRLMSEFGLSHIRRQKAGKASAANEQAAIEHAPGDVLPELRVAIVHDFLYTYAGAERVLEQLVNVFPHSDLFSLFDFLPEGQRGFIKNKTVTTSFLQKMPLAKRRHRAYLPLMPMAIEQLDMTNYDLILSSSYVAAKGVITRPGQLHVCYCHTPVRFAWDMQNQYLKQVGLRRGLRSFMAKLVLHYIRAWDVRSANSVDTFVTNSDFVGKRVQKLYRRVSSTIYPPVDTDFFGLHERKESFYLTASRMVPYKRIDLIVEAFAAMPDRRLIVIGDGPEMARIKAKAAPNITILGHESAERLRSHMQMAKAFVFAGEEDFGIAPVEAMACGTPVIAFGRGGVTETVVPGKTGLLFDKQTVEAITEAIERFETIDWVPAAIREHAEQFSAAAFRNNITQLVETAWSQFSSKQARSMTVDTGVNAATLTGIEDFQPNA